MICYKCRQATVEGPRGGIYPSPGINLCLLHAAAPALLEALEACEAALTHVPTSWGAATELAKARAAIAQAKRETA